MKIILIALLMLIGYAGSTYAITNEIKPTQRELKFTVELVFLSREAAFDFCKNQGMWPGINTLPRGTKAFGCTTFYRESKRCVIVTPEPMFLNDPAMLNLGEEISHCAFGDFHD